MNDDFSEKLGQILSNPAMMAQIKSLADTMTQNGAVVVDKTPVFDVYKNGGVVYIRANGRDKTKQKKKKTYDKRSLKSV